ncbi:periplasmic heavy metal sensor [Hasllibacter sp. MH4015]|uniref:periplasmic heavy metal sensor n=1 Tax=Hasllibacter sp. MH4015 TaxID=2854029 RepID=UPI001CD4136E|nr:periplasmic heavy metal sensor [Hasllibacter sp. MH4015]
MSDPIETPTRKGAGRWVKIALAVSLALNLAIVGLIGGVVLGREGGPGDRGTAPALRTLGLGPFVVALSREDRQDLRGRIEAQGNPLREERRAIGRSLRAVQEALRADPFDRAAAEAALRASRTSAIALQEAGHTALLDQVETMTAEERRALADNLERMMRRLGGRGRAPGGE